MTSTTFQANTWIGRLLLVKRSEFAAVAWSFTYFFFVLSAYYIIRPIREMTSAQSGTETIPILFSSTFVVMLFAAPIFGWVSSRYTRRQFLPWIYLFFAANLMLFWGAFSYAKANELDFVWLGRTFFVWISIFNLFVVSVFWSFMADIYTKDQGRRLFGLVSAGGSLGAIVGPSMTGLFATDIGFENMLPVSAACLLVAVFCITQLRQWVRKDRGEEKSVAINTKPLGGTALGGNKQLLSSRYLTSIAIISILASLMGTALYMFMAEMVSNAFSDPNEQTRTFAMLDALTNVLSFLGALFLVNRSVKHMGMGMTLAIMPVISLIGFAVLALNPVFIAVAVLQALRRGIGFGFTKPTMDMLYSVVPPRQKYKAKNFIDTAIYRGGDLIGSWTILGVWSLGVAGISLLMLPFALIWIGLSTWLGRDYRRRDTEGMGSETS